MQYQEVAGGICAPKGFAAAGVHCGIRANHAEKYDLALIKADVRCAAAGVYTTNKVCGAPIKVDRAHLKDGYAQAIIVNSGNANTCAANGVALAEECCELVGKELGIDPQDVLPASTGVIGQPMVIDPFARGIPAAAAKLAADEQGSTDAATAIMTTDTHKKEYAIQFELGGKTCTVGAIGKGSGMIAPNMATMLAFYTTDAAVSPILLEKALKTVVPGTYNQMSVDLARRRTHRGLRIAIVVFIIIAVIAAAVFAAARYVFKVKEINITGSDRYSYDELYKYIFADRNADNTILFSHTNKKAGKPDIPFIAKTDISVKWPDTINITVYDKSLVGYVEYKGTNMYFDKDGVVVDSSPDVFEDVPKITGLKFKTIVINDKLDVEDPAIFGTISDVKQYISQYNLTIDALNIEQDGTLSVDMGGVKALLGNNDNLMPDKIYELSCMADSIKDLKGVLHLEKYDGNSQNIILKQTE